MTLTSLMRVKAQSRRFTTCNAIYRTEIGQSKCVSCPLYVDSFSAGYSQIVPQLFLAVGDPIAENLQ